jgi:RNA polymerase sigma-70 factor (ECF subfamily)
VTTVSEREDALEALSAVVRGGREGLARAARREGLGAEDAVECVQDALCTFLTMFERGEVTAPRERWPDLLAGIVRNAARNRRRRHALAKTHAPIEESDRAGESPRADDLVAWAEEHLRLRACVAELCEVQRAIVTLRLLDEHPGEDVARSLGISRGYVDVLTHRAKAALRACMLRRTGAET